MTLGPAVCTDSAVALSCSSPLHKCKTTARQAGRELAEQVATNLPFSECHVCHSNCAILHLIVYAHLQIVATSRDLGVKIYLLPPNWVVGQRYDLKVMSCRSVVFVCIYINDSAIYVIMHIWHFFKKGGGAQPQRESVHCCWQ